MSKFNSAWYLIYTRPNHERVFARHLAENKIEFLLPTNKVKRIWHDRTKIIDIPLFPSYVFVHVKSMADYYNCMEAGGFCYYVKFGNQLAVINQKIIEDIDLIVRKGKNIEVSPNVHYGQKVVISQGPLCGLSGELVTHKGKEKVCVRINLFNRVILTDLNSNMMANEAPAYALQIRN